jgi:hypothetical protein
LHLFPISTLGILSVMHMSYNPFQRTYCTPASPLLPVHQWQSATTIVQCDEQRWPKPYIHSVYTVSRAGTSPNIRSYTVHITVLANPSDEHWTQSSNI